MNHSPNQIIPSQFSFRKIKAKWLNTSFQLTVFCICSFISYIIPKKKNKIVFFCNESGLFGGNIKPMFIHSFNALNGKNIHLLTFSSTTVKEVQKLGFPVIHYPSFEGLWHFLRAEKVVVECGMRLEICGLAMNAKVFQLWHGANLKYMVKQSDAIEKFKGYNLFEKWIRLIKTNIPKYEFIVSPSKFYKENTFSKSFSSKKVVVAGYPRNDLFLRDTRGEDWISSDKSLVDLAISHRANNGKVILYCPTWRDNANRSEDVNPFPEGFIRFLEENNILFIVKKHHRDKRTVYDKKHRLIKTYNHNKDVYLLMKNSDLLITDYSSIFFDYLLLNKPVVFYPYDYDTYVTRDRMFQYDYSEFTPGKKCQDDVELVAEINQAFLMGKDYYFEARKKIKEIAFDADHCVNSSEKIWTEINKDDIAASNYVNNSIHTVINRVVSVVITFLSMVLIARGLGPEGQGKYSLLVQLSRTFFYFFSFGFPIGMIFYFGRNPDQRQKTIKTFLYIYGAMTIVGLIFSITFGYYGHEHFFRGIDLEIVLMATIGIPLWFGNSYLGAIYQGLEKFKRLNANALSQPIILLVGISFLFLTQQVTVKTTLAVYLLSLCVNFILGLYYIKKDKFELGVFKNKFDQNILKESAPYSFKSYLGSIAEFLIYRVDMYIIAFFLTKKALGLYVVAVNIVERLWIFSEAISKVLFAKLVNTKGREQKNYYTIYTLQGTFVVGVLGGIFFYVLGELFIRLFFGKDFSLSAHYLYILVPGVVLQSLGLIMKKILEARGFPGTNARSSIFCLFVNIALNISLIPIMGVKGAAIATTMAYSLYFFFQSRSIKEKFGIKRRDYIIITPKEIKTLIDALFKNKFSSIQEEPLESSPIDSF